MTMMEVFFLGLLLALAVIALPYIGAAVLVLAAVIWRMFQGK